MKTIITATLESRTISVWIDRDPWTTYQFVANPENLPKWAAGVCHAIERLGDIWIAESSQGPIRIRFTPHNVFGVLDHFIDALDGEELYVPMRAIGNGTGTELMLTLHRRASMSREWFEQDARSIGRDLLMLKTMLES